MAPDAGSTSASPGTSTYGIDPERLRLFEHPQEKLSHYSKRTVDIEYKFDFAGSEWGELEGIANRTDYDLTVHGKATGTDLSYFDQESGERWTPYVIEPAAGVDRCTLTFLLDAYVEDEAPNAKGGVDKRVVLKLDPRLAPVKAAVLPLSRNADLSPVAKDLAQQLRAAVERRLRRRRRDRPSLPPAGRGRHAVLRDRRLRLAAGPGRDRPRARRDDAGAGVARPRRGLPRRVGCAAERPRALSGRETRHNGASAASSMPARCLRHTGAAHRRCAPLHRAESCPGGVVAQTAPGRSGGPTGSSDGSRSS